MKEFEITITETIRKRAIVAAPDWEAAEEMAMYGNVEFENMNIQPIDIDVEEVE
jgi:hypothetical protein